jgi:hypothetical protein
MKKSILIFLFFITLGANAQGNLQFNRVVNFSATQSVADNTPTTFQTLQVPAGKVWKIENVMIGNKTPSGAISFCDICSASFNEIIAYMLYFPSIQNTTFPIWLSEGSYNFKISNLSGSSIRLLLASYSAIEFNVVQ